VCPIAVEDTPNAAESRKPQGPVFTLREAVDPALGEFMFEIEGPEFPLVVGRNAGG
jgi:hypothetical protein